MHRTTELDAHDEQQHTAEDDRIGKLVARLSRPSRSGGATIERAAILASGTDSAAILAWVDAHAGRPEALAPPVAGRGLHSATRYERAGADSRQPLRYVFPPDALR